MEIRIQLRDKDAEFLCRALYQGVRLQAGCPEDQRRLDAIIGTIRKQLNRELCRLNPPGPIE